MSNSKTQLGAPTWLGNNEYQQMANMENQSLYSGGLYYVYYYNNANYNTRSSNKHNTIIIIILIHI